LSEEVIRHAACRCGALYYRTAEPDRPLEYAGPRPVSEKAKAALAAATKAGSMALNGTEKEFFIRTGAFLFKIIFN